MPRLMPLHMPRRKPLQIPKALPPLPSLLLLAFVGLAGCTVGPDYSPPETTPPQDFEGLAEIETAVAADTALLAGEEREAGLGSAPTVYEAGEPEAAWWRVLGDPILDDLVERALYTNHDLRIAEATLRQARALYGVSRLDRYPVATASGSVTRERASVDTVGEDGEREQTFYVGGLDATWELDFFGRVRRQVEAAEADYASLLADRQAVAVSVSAEVALTYLELRGTQYRLQVARQNAENQRETYELTQALLEGGRGTDLDLARAEAQLQQTLASLPPLESSISAASHRLAVLVGEPPGALLDDLRLVLDLPGLPESLPIGEPSALLRRRADIRAAERRLAAATARVGVVVADLFPRVRLLGGFGFLTTSASNLGDSDTTTASIGPFLSWPAFDLGRVRQRIRAAEATADAELAAYEQTVLVALEETENALVDYARSRERQARLAVAADASARAADLARTRYRYGVDSFLTVLDSERRLLEAQDLEARSATDAAVAFVRLYKALGGAWETLPEPAS